MDSSGRQFVIRLRSLTGFGWVIGLLIVVPFVVQYPYFQAGFFYDDAFHVRQCRLIASGQQSLMDYLLLPHGEHLIPLWKLLFYCCWRVAGQDVFLIHSVITLLHGCSAVLVWLLVRHYSTERCALVAAFLWAAAAIGGWDGPELWIAASHLLMAVTLLLGAMCCLTQISSPRHHVWAVAMSVLLLMCLLTMGSLLVTSSVLLLQYWLFEHSRGTSLRSRVSWLTAWLAPCLVVGILHLIHVLPAMQNLDRPGWNVFRGLQMLGGGYALSAWHLFWWSGVATVQSQIPGIALIWLLLQNRRVNDRKLCLLFFGLSFSFSLLAYMARSGWEVSHVLSWGRYRYLPTLFWCVVAGLVAGNISVGWPIRRSRAVFAVTAAVLLLIQVRLAHRSATAFHQVAATTDHGSVASESTDSEKDRVQDARTARSAVGGRPQ